MTKNVAKNKMSSATMDLCRTTPLVEQTMLELVQQDYKHSSFGEIKINDDARTPIH